MNKKIIEFIGKAVYDVNGGMLWSEDQTGCLSHLIDIRSYGRIQNLFLRKLKGQDLIDTANKFQDELGEFIAEAINEKIERETSGIQEVQINELKGKRVLIFEDSIDIEKALTIALDSVPYHPVPAMEAGEALHEIMLERIPPLIDMRSMIDIEKEEEVQKKKTLNQRGIPDPNQGRFRNRHTRK